eukprot:TRINITY_DN5860_c0_g1_i1.p1 TRINITY_DN5860_c0_g1~~TRINITY_DN5860_c0_g1_i1.p1  ORF type:complete len:286 (+),score=14.29 TRINITY_DN5860_c0_g1_i1:330-1187(+)
MTDHESYLMRLDNNSLLFAKKHDVKFFLVLLSGVFSYTHDYFFLHAFQTSSSTVLLPLMQFCSIWVFVVSLLQSILKGEALFEIIFEICAFVLILVGGILPAVDGKLKKLLQPNFWMQSYLVSIFLSEISHGIYSFMISFDHDHSEHHRAYNIWVHIEYFILTRVCYVIAFALHTFFSSKVKDELWRIQDVSSRSIVFSLFCEFFTQIGYFSSVYSYQIYSQVGVLHAAETSLHQLFNLIIAFILKRYYRIGRQAAVENMGPKIASFLLIALGLFLAVHIESSHS